MRRDPATLPFGAGLGYTRALQLPWVGAPSRPINGQPGDFEYVWFN
jgi:hypothetical protein